MEGIQRQAGLLGHTAPSVLLPALQTCLPARRHIPFHYDCSPPGITLNSFQSHPALFFFLSRSLGTIRGYALVVAAQHSAHFSAESLKPTFFLAWGQSWVRLHLNVVVKYFFLIKGHVGNFSLIYFQCKNKKSAKKNKAISKNGNWRRVTLMPSRIWKIH